MMYYQPQTDPLLEFIIQTIVFFIAVYIIRAIFRVPTILGELQQQTGYLKDIAASLRILLEKQNEKDV